MNSSAATVIVRYRACPLRASEEAGWEDLFTGFTALKAITFSSSIELLLRLSERLDDMEVVFGSESILSKEHLALACDCWGALGVDFSSGSPRARYGFACCAGARATRSFTFCPGLPGRGCSPAPPISAVRPSKAGSAKSSLCSNGRPAAASRNQNAKLDVDHGQLRRTDMDKDRIEGAAHQVKGTVKEGIGKITGDAKTQAEGAAEKATGKVQNAVGGAKDAVRDSLKK